MAPEFKAFPRKNGLKMLNIKDFRQAILQISGTVPLKSVHIGNLMFVTISKPRVVHVELHYCLLANFDRITHKSSNYLITFIHKSKILKKETVTTTEKQSVSKKRYRV
jgi:hypothetical protein